MENKITKERISNHLEYDWFKYLLIIAAGLAAVIFMFGQIASDRDEEVFTIFFSSYQLHENDYSANTVNAFSDAGYDTAKYGAAIMRKVGFDYVSPVSSDYSTLYSTRGVYSSDAAVVPKSVLFDSAEESYYPAAGYLALSGEMLDDMGITSDYELLRLDENFKRIETGGTVYGIRVDTLKNINKLASFTYEEYESEFYLAISRSGANVGKINKKDNPSDRQTFFCLKMFFSLYGN